MRIRGRHLKVMKVLERGGMMKLKPSWMLSWMDLLIGGLMRGGESFEQMKLMISERSVRTDISREGTPGTPSKKRVRYADEEQLPLETFKDPSPNRYVHLPLTTE
jgi:hypothetical protein